MTALKGSRGVVLVYLFRTQSYYLKEWATNSLNEFDGSKTTGSVVSVRRKLWPEQAAGNPQLSDGLEGSEPRVAKLLMFQQLWRMQRSLVTQG